MHLRKTGSHPKGKKLGKEFQMVKTDKNEGLRFEGRERVAKLHRKFIGDVEFMESCRLSRCAGPCFGRGNCDRAAGE
jgi:hypothetical protein